ncbi:hypothetical protein BKA65DRAFT_503209 [Rhexocercosporidium sp. MPI-PUGE-AT-0058]|nr:hypothetical protein BKA65DRAFT_503209 [Rhexocercosporidium sp. MPI-PUGE-AT-0058]
MHSHLAALLSLLWLLVVCEACPLGNHATAYSPLPNFNQTLFRRNIGTGGYDAPSASELFSIGSTPGGCSSQSAIIDDWVKEAILLHDAVETAYSDYKSDLGLRALWSVYMGIEFNIDGTLLESDTVELRWGSIGGRISDVSQFLAGAGLTDAKTSSPPWLFCSADAGKYIPFDDMVQDENGEYIVFEVDETGEIPTDYLTVGQVFPSVKNSGNGKAFFMNAFNGYNFDYSSFDALCDKPGRYAVTAFPTQATNPGYEEITFAAVDRNVLLCPKTFAPGDGEWHSYSSLADLMTAENYPTVDDTGLSLDRVMPLGTTLYHELYHLGDAAGTTRDPYYKIVDVLRAAGNKAVDIPNNPESFVFFAVAVYLYLNPPEGKEAVLYLGGFPGSITWIKAS